MCRRTSNCKFSFFLKLAYPSERNLQKKTKNVTLAEMHYSLRQVPLKKPCEKCIKDFQSWQKKIYHKLTAIFAYQQVSRSLSGKREHRN